MEIKDLSEGLRALTVEDEQREVLAVLNGKGDTMDKKTIDKEMLLAIVASGAKAKGTVIEYLNKSFEMGLPLWNVYSPVAGYNTGKNAGYPTFSYDTLVEKGLI